MLLTQQLLTVASANGTRSAFRFLGKETTYNELRTSVARLSYLYQHDFGQQPARVAFLTRNSPAFYTTFLALTNIRTPCIPVDPELTDDEIAQWLKESKATHVAATNDLVGRAKELLQHARLSLPVIEIEKKIGGEYDTSFTPPPDKVPREEDPVLLLRTAGTTGKPKLVVLNHKQLQHATMSIRSGYHATANDRFFTHLNWCHAFGLIHGLMFPLSIGATCVVDLGLQGKELLEFLVESRVTRIAGTPPFFLKTLVTCRNEKRNLPGTRSVTVGMGLVSPEMRKAFEFLKVPVMQSYGMTEATWTLAMEDSQEPSREENGYCGKGLPGIKYKVLDIRGEAIEEKGPKFGMLAVTGPNVMGGYFEKEKETKDMLKGTWLYTQDYVRLEEEDDDSIRICFLGRKDTVIITDHEIMNARELDRVVKTIHGVQDAGGFVIQGLSEPAFACAVVRAKGSTLTEKHVLEACMSRLPMEQQPKIVVFTDAIPRDAAGNVNRLRLRSVFSGTVG